MTGWTREGIESLRDAIEAGPGPLVLYGYQAVIAEIMTELDNGNPRGLEEALDA